MSGAPIGEIVVQPFSIRHSFDSAEEVLHFVAKEWATWNDWFEQIKAAPRVSNLRPNDDLLTEWANIKDQVRRQPDGTVVGAVQAMQLLQNALNDRRVVLSGTSAGASILNIADTNPSLSGFLMSLNRAPNLGANLVNYNAQILGLAVTGLIEAIPNLTASKTVKRYAQEVKENAERTSSLLSETLNNSRRLVEEGTTSNKVLQEAIKDGRSDLAQMLRLGRSSVKTQRKAFDDDWAALRRTYDLKLKTKAPFSYWRGKERLHRRAINTWRNYLAWIFGLGFPATIVAAYCLGSYKTEGPLPWLTSAVVVGGCAFVTVWLARLANRQLVDQLLRMEDSRERSIMVRTLLALSRQDNSGAVASEANINAMLAALYRPGPGLSADDSPSVSLAEALLKSLQGPAHKG